MNTERRGPIGVCNWSLGQGIGEVRRFLEELGVRHVHLDAGPALGEGGAEYLADVRAAGWTVTSAMIGFPQEDYSTLESIRRTGGVMPDGPWPANRDRFLRAADAAAALGAPFLSMHAGFLDPSDAAARAVFGRRMLELAEAAARRGLLLLMETGQERAEELRSFLEDAGHPALAVNLDPANMILYDRGDPIEAVRLLAPWIRHVHIKDAVRSGTPGRWGAETPWGEGDVGAGAFLAALDQIGYGGPLAVEREAGDDRPGDIRRAVARLRAARGGGSV